MVKTIRLPMQETWVPFLPWEDPLEKEMAAHSSILALRIPWTEEPGRLHPMGLQRVRRDFSFIFNVTVCMEKGAGNFDDFVEYRCSSRNDFYSKPTNFLNEVGWGHRIRVCFKYWKPTNRFTA